jgi:hypothetical protein
MMKKRAKDDDRIILEAIPVNVSLSQQILDLQLRSLVDLTNDIELPINFAMRNLNNKNEFHGFILETVDFIIAQRPKLKTSHRYQFNTALGNKDCPWAKYLRLMNNVSEIRDNIFLQTPQEFKTERSKMLLQKVIVFQRTAYDTLFNALREFGNDKKIHEFFRTTASFRYDMTLFNEEHEEHFAQQKAEVLQIYEKIKNSLMILE